MSKKLFLRKDNIIQGPFPAEHIRQLLHNGLLTYQDEVSADKKNFRSIAQEFDLVIPTPEHTTEQPAEQVPEPAEMPEQETNDYSEPIGQTADEPAAAMEIPPGIAPDNSFKTILGETIEILFNSHGALLKLFRRDLNSQIGAGFMALILSLGITALGAGLFAIRYNVPQVVLWMRALSFVLAGGLVFYLGNSVIRWLGCDPAGKYPGQGESDFLSAMGALLNLAGFYTLSAAVLFLFNTRLYDPDFLRQSAALAVFALPMLFTLSNAILALRLNFLFSNKFRTSTALILAVAEVWMVLAIYSFTVLTVFTA